ncbi:MULTISPECIES: MarR family winged helix-turn-helix transcriptional regulator [Gordonia]|uniref:MarR family transcriptional regulator n=1 Tax=Gordonia amicalis TaxID=89053 RepID=A0AAE4R669_9ACTN|nr:MULTISPECIES: MarR family transcriptional regulator [Gordonia]ATD71037.1 MarR family transcriptional regulator [Gordonia sp. 1D]MCZ4653386.1 MarR family transcriptional regulator [Gordonia amicalis]MDJ0453135.1 MarR family transcriptional regulator [Gordonia amicalis]MDV6312433.1 MarR family transcriptional regulator [Gordonia amicalis]MDV7077394.1 MarR family transcriptional regulator [Gordonia amicalis]
MSGEQEPRWLDDEEMDAWIQVATALARLPHALDAQLLREAQLTHFEYEVLSALSEAPDRTLRMSELAEMSYGSLSRLSHVVGRLEKREWVRRHQCPEDGRFTNAVLTEAGWEKVVATAPGYVANVRRLVVDRVTRAQLRQVSAIGRRVNDSDEPGRR